MAGMAADQDPPAAQHHEVVGARLGFYLQVRTWGESRFPAAGASIRPHTRCIATGSPNFVKLSRRSFAVALEQRGNSSSRD
jgi:hypothetical protein